MIKAILFLLVLSFICMPFCGLASANELPGHSWHGVGLNLGAINMKCTELNKSLKKEGFPEISSKFEGAGFTWYQVDNTHRILGLNIYTGHDKKTKSSFRYSELRPCFINGSSEFFYGLFITLGGFGIKIPMDTPGNDTKDKKKTELKADGWALNLGLSGYYNSGQAVIGLNLGTLVPISFGWEINNEKEVSQLPSIKSMGYGIFDILYTGDKNR